MHPLLPLSVVALAKLSLPGGLAACTVIVEPTVLFPEMGSAVVDCTLAFASLNVPTLVNCTTTLSVAVAPLIRESGLRPQLTVPPLTVPGPLQPLDAETKRELLERCTAVLTFV